jgi:type I restriction-modification system DNA methylase subunit
LSREAPFQDRLRDVIQSVISKFKFNGLTFSRVERGFKIDAREPDLTLFDEGGRPFLVVETKRKVELPHWRARALFQPLGRAAVGQAISYVALWEHGGRGRIPFFATATPSEVAVFRAPDDLLSYVNMDMVLSRDYENVVKPGMFTALLKHLVFHGRLELTEEFVERLLDAVAKDYLKARVSRVPPGWALVEFLRGFVDVLSEKCEPMVKLRSESDVEFRRMLEETSARLGYTPDVRSLSRMMAYILMNKLVFYKVLEQRYRGLPRLINLPTSSKAEFMRALNSYFEKAVSETRDFEPIFKAGIYDLIDLPDEVDTLEFVNEFVATLESMRLEELGDYLSYVYEELIPPSERHQLGQFYTPPAVCELIVKWAVRSPEDLVLDPGCGSGGFLSAAYRVLVKLKTGRDAIPPPRGVHERVIAQLYGVDINPFPAHLSAVNLAMKDVRSPSTGLNIIEHDFFYLEPKTRVLAPYTIRTAAGVEFRREAAIPIFDAVVGNPPYTRWVEIPEQTKNAIRNRLGDYMRKYGLTPQLARGVEPGIYTYWIMHATRFLKPGGRLGMIISNLWMQTEYGVGFGQFLLDNYKVKAVIDFTLRLFTALISTCVVLLEREEDALKRAENEAVFIHIPGTIESIDVDEVLKAVERGRSEKLYVKVVKQKEIPRNEKWIKVLFGVEDVFKHPLMVKLGELFEPSRGNLYWGVWALQHGRRPDVGASGFAYLSPSKVRQFKLERFSYPNVPLDQAIVYPAITSARDAVYFTFTEDDWRELYGSDKECFMFICHKPRNELPEEVLEYIRWGEPICPECGKELTAAGDTFKCERGHLVPLGAKCITELRGTRGGGRLACETESAKVRARMLKEFYGWYDLGGVEPAPIFAIRQARYKTRFMLCRFPVAMYDALIALIPKPEASLTDGQIKALLAYLNSSLMQYYIETRGRYIAKGPIGLEVNMVREMPILDVRKLPNELVTELASLFDRLEAEARRIGGASRKEDLEKLKPVIQEVDRALAKLLDMPEDVVKSVEDQVDMLVERRIAGSKEERRESVRGEAEVKLKPPRRRRRTEAPPKAPPLDRFMAS